MILGRWPTVLLVLGASLLGAQQVPGSSPTPGSSKASSPADAPVDYAKLAADIGASYYHPDDLSGLDCATIVDFGSLFKQLGQTPTEELMKQLGGITVKVHAMRDQVPKIDIAWPNGAPVTKQQAENSITQALGGFFQMYWAFLASPMSGFKQQDLTKIETLAGGGRVLRGSDQGAEMTMEVDRDNAPTRFSVDKGPMKVNLEFHFAPTQVPAPGDLRRLTFLDYVYQMGTNAMNGRISNGLPEHRRIQRPATLVVW